MLLSLDHVLLAMPPGGEEKARRFYQEVLGVPEVRKPAVLEARGGCWFERGEVRIHLGVEADFRPARKAHPAFVVEDVRALADAVVKAGYQIAEDEPLEGYDRIFAYDPFGNRIEFLSRW